MGFKFICKKKHISGTRTSEANALYTANFWLFTVKLHGREYMLGRQWLTRKKITPRYM